MDSTWEQETRSGDRFPFGENWLAFLSSVDERRIALAQDSLKKMLLLDSLENKTFLDIGSGSGLFSLAARRMGAKVFSFDFDSQSVACTEELRRRFSTDDDHWQIKAGSVLDLDFLSSLGQFDVVYSWGVLHHTGNLKAALSNACIPVKPGGFLFISVYNDQGRASRYWHKVKSLYNRLPPPMRWLVLYPSLARLWGPTLVRDTLKLSPLSSWKNYWLC